MNQSDKAFVHRVDGIYNQNTGNIHWYEEFENGYAVSVVAGPHTYGGDRGLYELAVMRNGEIHYNNPVARGDVRGYLSMEEVDDLVNTVSEWDIDEEFDNYSVNFWSDYGDWN